MSNKQNTITIKTIFGKLKVGKEQEQAWVLEHTNGRTTHVSEMTVAEGTGFIPLLNSLQKELTPPDRDAMDRMRKKIISKFREMEYNVYDSGKQKMKADMIRIEETTIQHWGKLLNEFDAKELSKIIAVLDEKWLPWFYANKNKSNAES